MLKLVPVVIGILKKDDSFLIAKRPPQVVMSGYWEFPGGKIEIGESQQAALVREFQEEIGINILNAQFLTQFSCPFPNRIIELNVWQILTHQGIPQGKEGQEISWATIAQFKNFNFLPSNRELLDFLENTPQI
ncbi:MAG: mutT [Gammaproteobacteria bacterium]|jgi:8-oxo-dGTP diphosphatase|nr:mutT [Gammaproteobacteria bacterium]